MLMESCLYVRVDAMDWPSFFNLDVLSNSNSPDRICGPLTAAPLPAEGLIEDYLVLVNVA